MELDLTVTVEEVRGEWLAAAPTVPGLVAVGLTRDAAVTELVRSLAVKLAHDLGMSLADGVCPPGAVRLGLTVG